MNVLKFELSNKKILLITGIISLGLFISILVKSIILAPLVPNALQVPGSTTPPPAPGAVDQVITGTSNYTVTVDDPSVKLNLKSNNRDAKFTYKVDKPDIISITNDEMKFIGGGTAVITALEPGNSKYLPGQFVITVIVNKKFQVLSIPPDNLNNVYAGTKNTNLGVVTTGDSDCNKFTIEIVDAKPVGCVTVENGLLNAITPGTATINIKSEGSSKYNPALIKVENLVIKPNPNVPKETTAGGAPIPPSSVTLLKRTVKFNNMSKNLEGNSTASVNNLMDLITIVQGGPIVNAVFSIVSGDAANITKSSGITTAGSTNIPYIYKLNITKTGIVKIKVVIPGDSVWAEATGEADYNIFNFTPVSTGTAVGYGFLGVTIGIIVMLIILWITDIINADKLIESYTNWRSEKGKEARQTEQIEQEKTQKKSSLSNFFGRFKRDTKETPKTVQSEEQI